VPGTGPQLFVSRIEAGGVAPTHYAVLKIPEDRPGTPSSCVDYGNGPARHASAISGAFGSAARRRPEDARGRSSTELTSSTSRLSAESKKSNLERF